MSEKNTNLENIDYPLPTSGLTDFIRYEFSHDQFSVRPMFVDMLVELGKFSVVVADPREGMGDHHYRTLITRHEAPNNELYVMATTNRVQAVGDITAIGKLDDLMEENYGSIIRTRERHPIWDT